MKRIDSIYSSSAILFVCYALYSIYGCGAFKTVTLDNSNIRVINRNFVQTTDIASDIVSLDRKPGAGLAILQGPDFETGTIEVDFRGENNPGKSFVGIAFNIQNDSTFEAIYFRPFNFHSPEDIRRQHSMQYIHHPDYGWRKLRTEQEGIFEAEYFNAPNPDDWFSIRLDIGNEFVEVFDAGSGNSLMRVKRLTAPLSPRIGFWTGHNSTGSFKNLKIGK